MVVPTSKSRCFRSPPIISADNSPYRREILPTRSTTPALTTEAAVSVEFPRGFVDFGRRGFLHLDGARKQYIILQVNVLMQIGLEIGQRLIQGLITGAGVRRRREITGCGAQRPQQIARCVMLQHHHSHWVLNRAEERRRNRSSIAGGLLHPRDVWKENLFLFEHVGDQVLLELIECLLRLEQFRMVFAVARADPVEEFPRRSSSRPGEGILRSMKYSLSVR